MLISGKRAAVSRNQELSHVSYIFLDLFQLKNNCRLCITFHVQPQKGPSRIELECFSSCVPKKIKHQFPGALM